MVLSLSPISCSEAIMVYPTYRAKDVNIPKLDNVSGFFDRNPPANWTPRKFAHDHETLSLDDFTNDLKIIKEMGRNPYNAYAGECYRWMRENKDNVHVTEAKSILEAKLTRWSRYRKDIQTRDTFESRDLDQAQTALSPDLVKSAYNAESTSKSRSYAVPFADTIAAKNTAEQRCVSNTPSAKSANNHAKRTRTNYKNIFVYFRVKSKTQST
jgi:hypothetical protein